MCFLIHSVVLYLSNVYELTIELKLSQFPNNFAKGYFMTSSPIATHFSSHHSVINLTTFHPYPPFLFFQSHLTAVFFSFSLSFLYLLSIFHSGQLLQACLQYQRFNCVQASVLQNIIQIQPLLSSSFPCSHLNHSIACSQYLPPPPLQDAKTSSSYSFYSLVLL